MKILMVNKFLVRRGGVETYVIDLGGLLERAGHEVQYFGMDDPDRAVGNKWNMYAPRVELGGRQSAGRIKDVARMVDSTENALLMSALLHAFEPDVVHFNNIHYHLTPSVLESAFKYREATQKQVSVVMTMHDYHTIVPCDGCMNVRTYEVCDECLDGRFIRCAFRGCVRGGRAKSVVAALEAGYWASKHVYRGLDSIVCPSAFMKDQFDKIEGFQRYTVHLPNFANLERKTSRKERYVLYFGAYNRDKGVGTLLEIARRHPDIRFKFAGRGSLSSVMKGISNVEDLGFRTGEGLRDVVRKAALAVVPSECLENSPFTVLEALCCGTPVLGANVGGIPELVSDGLTGELFEFRNPNDLEGKLVSLWSDPDRLACYASNCASFDPMSPERYLRELMAVYSGTLEVHT